MEHRRFCEQHGRLNTAAIGSVRFSMTNMRSTKVSLSPFIYNSIYISLLSDIPREDFANIPKEVGQTVLFRARIHAIRPMSMSLSQPYAYII